MLEEYESSQVKVKEEEGGEGKSSEYDVLGEKVEWEWKEDPSKLKLA